MTVATYRFITHERTTGEALFLEVVLDAANYDDAIEAVTDTAQGLAQTGYPHNAGDLDNFTLISLKIEP